MCRHYGDPDEPCPLCECGCGNATGLYAFTNRGRVKGQHKRYFGTHAGRSMKKTGAGEAAMPESPENDALLARLLRQALASGAAGDDLVKVFLDSHELATAIVLAQVQKALAGNVQSANWLFQRGIGTAAKKSTVPSKSGLSFLDPLDSVDKPYDD